MTEEREVIRARYAAAAGTSLDPVTDCGCGPAHYAAGELADLPAAVTDSSLGCANPLAVAELRPGEVVLDLGSGGGLDVLLSARRVGHAGKAYGLDMTDEMLALARQNQEEAGVQNAEFLKGHIEALPLPSSSVDVIISNCVINLSVDKPAVFAEMFRVLRQPGRIAVADLVADEGRPGEPDLGSHPPELPQALTRAAYREALEKVGFRSISMIESHLGANGLASVIVRANKP